MSFHGVLKHANSETSRGSAHAVALCRHILEALPSIPIHHENLLSLVLETLPTHGPGQTLELVAGYILDGSCPALITRHLDSDSNAPSLDAQSMAMPIDMEEIISNRDAHGSSDSDIECQCCYSSVPPARIVLCPGGHPACISCLQAHVASQLGRGRIDVKCMSATNLEECRHSLPRSALEGCLPPPLLSLYNQVALKKDLRDARIQGLEECPFCDFACIIEEPVEEMSIFLCGDDRCGLRTCRMCRRQEHPGRHCGEGKDDMIEQRKWLEEEMTKALLRICPKCQFNFVKEDGVSKEIRGSKGIRRSLKLYTV